MVDRVTGMREVIGYGWCGALRGGKEKRIGYYVSESFMIFFR
jgi:hypothetical protein